MKKSFLFCAAAVATASAAEFCDSRERGPLGRHQVCNDGTECTPSILDCSLGLDKCMCGTRPGLRMPMMGVATGEMCSSLARDEFGHRQFCSDGTECRVDLLDCSMGPEMCMCGTRPGLRMPMMGVATGEMCNSLARDEFGHRQVCSDGTECRVDLLDCSMGPEMCMCGTRATMMEIVTEIDIPAGTELCDATASPKQLCSDGIVCDANILDCALGQELCICGTAPKHHAGHPAVTIPETANLRAARQYLKTLGAETMIRQVRQTLDHAPHAHVPAGKRTKLVQTSSGAIYHGQAEPSTTVLQQHTGRRFVPSGRTTGVAREFLRQKSVDIPTTAARYGSIGRMYYP